MFWYIYTYALQTIQVGNVMLRNLKLGSFVEIFFYFKSKFTEIIRP